MATSDEIWMRSRETDEEYRKDIEQEMKDFPLGSLGLPPLLDQRRIEHEIPKGFFDQRYVGDHCLVWQLDPSDDGYFEGSEFIVKTAKRQEYDRNTHTHGILCNAGMGALDKLRSNGIDLGHHVLFLRYNVFNPIMSMVGGKKVTGADILATDIRASVDLEEALREGRCKIVQRDYEIRPGMTITEHRYVDENGKEWTPLTINQSDNYA